ncbi:MAG: peroxiredoxin [Nevskiaceae bacterium]|nr:MAG: peroxiredoxin [Nevskiaceae bacterium]
MRRWATLSLLAAAMPVYASLKLGAHAPDFNVQGALDGKPFAFSLADALKQGPVVLYFYPKAFTSGCTVEAHLFAEASDQFKALGAQVIGLSGDDIDTLKKFSVAECRSKFPVAADPDLKVAKAYDATLFMWPGHADRTSYVIAPDGTVIYSYSALAPDQHVSGALQALRDWRQQHPLAAAK